MATLEVSATETKPQIVQREGCCRSCTCCDCLWLVKNVEGWFKILEFFTTFLSFVILSAFPGSNKSQYEFHVFVATTACIFVVLHILLRIFHLYEKMPEVLIRPRVGFYCCIIAVGVLLISSGVVMAYSGNIDSLKASAALGFIAAILFACEAVWLYICSRRAASQNATNRTVDEEEVRDDFIQPSRPDYQTLRVLR